MSLSSTSASMSFATAKPPLAATTHHGEPEKQDPERGDDVREVAPPEPRAEDSKPGEDTPRPPPPPPPDGGTRAWMTVAGA